MIFIEKKNNKTKNKYRFKMGKYLKQFATHQQYEAYTANTSNFILPNVSYCIDTPNEVHYNPSSPTPPTPSHDYVEIGGIKWATMNIGATGITDGGLYFQWGDTQGYTAAQVGSDEGQKYFGWEDYVFGDYPFTKYNEEDGLTTLQASDDAVTAAWGGNWRMPTTEEFQALGAATTSARTDDYEGSGVAGLVLTSKADSSKVLFFPAYGTAYEGRIGNGGYYWSSSLDSGGSDYAYYLYFNKSINWETEEIRSYGYPVRGVLAN